MTDHPGIGREVTVIPSVTIPEGALGLTVTSPGTLVVVVVPDALVEPGQLLTHEPD